MTILQDALTCYNLSRPQNELGSIWGPNVAQIRQAFGRAQSAENLVDWADRTLLYAINFPPELAHNSGPCGDWAQAGDVPTRRQRQIDWLLAHTDCYPTEFGESEYIHSRNKSKAGKFTVSGNFLRTLSIAFRIRRFVGSPTSVLELGAGMGHQARTLLLQNDKIKYTICDLPETLVFSHCFLHLNFPAKRVQYVLTANDLNTDADIYLVPASLSDSLIGRKYDLFLNTASLGEMPAQTVTYWMDLIQNRLEIQKLYTLNRFLNTDMGREENACSARYDNKWDVMHWELEPQFCRCPYLDTMHSRYVEIAALRPRTDTIKERSYSALASALEMDWYALRGKWDGHTSRSNPYKGTEDALYALWNSVRLSPNKVNVAAMVLHLQQLPYIPEELSYYQRLLTTL